MAVGAPRVTGLPCETYLVSSALTYFDACCLGCPQNVQNGLQEVLRVAHEQLRSRPALCSDCFYPERILEVFYYRRSISQRASPAWPGTPKPRGVSPALLGQVSSCGVQGKERQTRWGRKGLLTATKGGEGALSGVAEL